MEMRNEKKALAVVLIVMLSSTGTLMAWECPPSHQDGTQFEPEPVTITTRSLADSAWPCHRGNSLRNGQAPINGSSIPPRLRWTSNIDYYLGGQSPAIGPDGTIYVSAKSYYMYAFNPDGYLKWKYNTNEYIYSTPAIDDTGNIYFTEEEGNLYCLYPNGTLKWRYPMGLGTQSSPAISANGTVYCTSKILMGSHVDVSVVALHPDGTLWWNCTIHDTATESSPAVLPNGTVYICCTMKGLVCINPNGTINWVYDDQVGRFLYSVPAVGPDGTIFISCSDAYSDPYDDIFHAVYPNGTRKWAVTLSPTDGSPSVSENGTVYVSTRDGNLTALYPNGTVMWKYRWMDWDYPSDAYSSPLITRDGVIFVGGNLMENFHAIYPNGTRKWVMDLDLYVFMSPAIDTAGSLYIVDNSGTLYAIGLSAPSKPSVTATGVDGKITIDWNPPEDQGGMNVTGYRIYRGTDPDNMTLIAAVDANTTSFEDTNVTNGQKYYYEVVATNEMGESSPGTTSAIPMTFPEPPINLQATAGDGFVNLTWQGPADNGGAPLLPFNIYRDTSPGAATLLGTAGNTSFTSSDTTVTNGQTYYYRVRSVNMVGESDPSNEVAVTPVGQLTAPLYLAATAGDGCVVLQWEPPVSTGGFNLTNFILHRGTTSGSLSELVNVSHTVTGYNDTGLTNGVTYHYQVFALSGAGTSPGSNEVSATPMRVPDAPTGLEAIAGIGVVNLSWDPPAYTGGSALLGYNIFRGDAPDDISIHTALGVNDTEYQDLDVQAGVEYHYFVTARNMRGSSNASNIVTAIPINVPGNVRNLSIVSGDSYLNVTWEAPNTDGGSPVTAYRVYRGGKPADAEELTSVGPGMYHYLDTDVVNGNKYYYLVTAENLAGSSGMEGPVSEVPMGLPDPPLELTAAVGDGIVTIGWGRPLNTGGSTLTGYRIYRGTDPENMTMMDEVLNTRLSFQDHTVENGLTYHYHITSVNGVGESSPSEAVSAVPMGLPSEPGEVSVEVGSGQVNVTWQPSDDNGGGDLTGYNLYRTTSGGNSEIIAELGPDDTSYTDDDVEEGITYSYYVRAVNAAGAGDASEPVEVTVPPGLAPPDTSLDDDDTTDGDDTDNETEEKEDDDGGKTAVWPWLLVLVVMVVVMIVLFLYLRRRREGEKEADGKGDGVEDDIGGKEDGGMDMGGDGNTEEEGVEGEVTDDPWGHDVNDGEAGDMDEGPGEPPFDGDVHPADGAEADPFAADVAEETPGDEGGKGIPGEGMEPELEEGIPLE